MNISKQKLTTFTSSVKAYYQSNARDLPWRHLAKDLQQRFYEVLVSEMMLQQTQVNRVTIKYAEWMACYPTLHSVAKTSLQQILQSWQGLGYNRRAKYLHETCRKLSATDAIDWHSELDNLPGVGFNTKGAILAYCYNEPAIFIETNIRTAVMVHFFACQPTVKDKEILQVVELTVDHTNPREWYWALMDYGTYLKKSFRINAQSAHYRKQTAFEGSSRQLRSRVLRTLLRGPREHAQLVQEYDDERLGQVLEGLLADKLVTRQGAIYQIIDEPTRPENI